PYPPVLQKFLTAPSQLAESYLHGGDGGGAKFGILAVWLGGSGIAASGPSSGQRMGHQLRGRGCGGGCRPRPRARHTRPALTASHYHREATAALPREAAAGT